MTLINPDEERATRAAAGEPATNIRIRQPKRILHFSDGILEEYSDDEDQVDKPTTQPEDLVDPSTLTWGPWLWYKAWRAGSSTLNIMDAAGEYLAAVFGITTPKYYFELEEYKRNNARAVKEDEERKGWSTNANIVDSNVEMDRITTDQPKPVDMDRKEFSGGGQQC